MSENLFGETPAPKERPKDLAYEALAVATGAHETANRGELNISLKQIREQTDIDDPMELAVEIHEQARRYRAVMPETMITPVALAKHWTRLYAETSYAARPKGTNLSVTPTDECPTCLGDRMVLVAERTPTTTSWMSERGISADGTTRLEEFAPCPSCNPIEVVTYRYDGSRVAALDPATTREMLGR